MHIKIPYFFIVVAAIVLCVSGCYTILTHPAIRHEQLESGSRVSFYDNCLQCHSESDVQYFYSEIRSNKLLTLDRPAIHETMLSVMNEPDPFVYYNYPWWYSENWINERYVYDRDENTKSGSQTNSSLPIQIRRTGTSRNSSGSPLSGSSYGSSSSTNSGSSTSRSTDSKSSDTNSRTRDNTSTQTPTDRSKDSSSTTNTTNDRSRDASSTRDNSSTNSQTRSGSNRGR